MNVKLQTSKIEQGWVQKKDMHLLKTPFFFVYSRLKLLRWFLSMAFKASQKGFYQ